jgi:hypothetical protein
VTAPSIWRARLSFPGATRSLLETGRLMARWAEELAEIVGPELTWEARVEEHADLALVDHWEASHVVTLIGRDAKGVERGRGESRLTAGGRGQRIGGSGRITLEAVGPLRRLDVTNTCDVTHWDVTTGALDETRVDAARVLLEALVGLPAHVSGDRWAPAEDALRVIAEDPAEDDVDTWLGDLDDVDVLARLEQDAGSSALIVEGASIADMDALREARLVLGEVLAEAGHEDWEERANLLLVLLTAKS